jgi:hypothetical protein
MPKHLKMNQPQHSKWGYTVSNLVSALIIHVSNLNLFLKILDNRVQVIESSHHTFSSVLVASLIAEAKYSARLGPEELDLVKTAGGPSFFVLVDFEGFQGFEFSRV